MRSTIQKTITKPKPTHDPTNHTEKPVKHKPAHRQVGRITPGQADPDAEVVSQEERTDNNHNGRKPDALRLPGNESFSKLEDATNPENLAEISVTK